MTVTVFSDQHRNRGFTVIELLVIISIIMSLSGIAVMKYTQASDAAKVATDMNNLRLLNGVTVNYAALRGLSGADIFAGLTNDAARMQALVTAGLLTGAPTPQKTGEQFNWNVSKQIWQYTGEAAAAPAAPAASAFYDFYRINLADFLKLGTWKQDPSKQGMQSADGTLFVPNPYTQYSVTTKVNMTNAKDNAVGILFDTTLGAGNLDTGYVLQLNRGELATLVIRRVDGTELAPAVTVTNAQDPTIPAGVDNPWWNREHDIRLDVTNVSGQNGMKQLTVYIDGKKLNVNYQFAGTASPTGSYTGVKSYGAETNYVSMKIESK